MLGTLWAMNMDDIICATYLKCFKVQNILGNKKHLKIHIL